MKCSLCILWASSEKMDMSLDMLVCFIDEMYAAIDEPGQVYTSGSETYAQIQPLALLEVTPELGSDSSHYPPQPPSVDSLKQVAQVHSRQGQYILWFIQECHVL
jgi:hypothetical protein